jgi:hypothetical protein
MELVVAVILVCGLLNMIPWFLLLYQRPDLQISDKVADIDTGLAQIAQLLLQKLDNLEELGASVAPAGENPILMFLQAMMNRQSIENENNLYGRSSDGTFNGTPEIIEAESPQNDRNIP